MNPCARYQRDIALLGVEALPEPAATELRRHLQTCPACQKYAAQWEGLQKFLSEPTSHLPELRLPAGFHERLQKRLQAESSNHKFAWVEIVRQWWTVPRLAGAAGAAFLMIALLRIDLTQPAPPSGKIVSQLESESAGPPPQPAPASRRNPFSLLAYQRALQESPAALDALVVGQARRDRAGEGMSMGRAMTGKL